MYPNCIFRYLKKIIYFFLFYSDPFLPITATLYFWQVYTALISGHTTKLFHQRYITFGSINVRRIGTKWSDTRAWPLMSEKSHATELFYRRYKNTCIWIQKFGVTRFGTKRASPSSPWYCFGSKINPRHQLLMNWQGMILFYFNILSSKIQPFWKKTTSEICFFHPVENTWFCIIIFCT